MACSDWERRALLWSSISTARCIWPMKHQKLEIWFTKWTHFLLKGLKILTEEEHQFSHPWKGAWLHYSANSINLLTLNILGTNCDKDQLTLTCLLEKIDHPTSVSCSCEKTVLSIGGSMAAQTHQRREIILCTLPPGRDVLMSAHWFSWEFDHQDCDCGDFFGDPFWCDHDRRSLCIGIGQKNPITHQIIILWHSACSSSRVMWSISLAIITRSCPTWWLNQLINKLGARPHSQRRSSATSNGIITLQAIIIAWKLIRFGCVWL